MYLNNHLIAAKPYGQWSTLVIKEGTKSITDATFLEAYIYVVYIPESIKYIPYSAFCPYEDELMVKPHLIVFKDSYAEEYAMKYGFS